MGRGILKLETRDLAYILSLFAVTRVGLLALGIAAGVLLSGLPLNAPGDLAQVWNVWDGSWYIGIARDGYSAAPVNVEHMANYAFFPLYPMLIRLAAAAIGNYALAGIVVSNVCLLVACFYLFRYVRLDEGADREAARRAVKYQLLFPLAFLFSAVLTEALFVALAIACLYYARRGRWAIAGPLGFLITLARPTGVVILVPMAYEYARQGRLSLKLSGASRWVKPQMLALLLPLFGMGLWATYNYYLTGDFLGFMHIQATWGGRFVLPHLELLSRLETGNVYVYVGAIATLSTVALLVVFYPKVDVGSWAFGLLLLGIPLFTTHSCYSMLRYLAVVFPLFIVLGKVTMNKRVDLALTAAVIALQIVLMTIWTTWSYFIV